MAAIFCTRCGQSLPDDARFCFACGAQVTDAARSAAPAPSDATTTAAFDVGALDPEAADDGRSRPSSGLGVLLVVRGPNAGSRFLLDREVTGIGRHPEADIFLDDVTVSRHHCEVTRQDGQFSVRDMGSLNGTYVNGARLDDGPLLASDELQVGRFKLLLLTGDPVADPDERGVAS